MISPYCVNFLAVFFLFLLTDDSRDPVAGSPSGFRVDRRLDHDDDRGRADVRMRNAKADQHQSERVHVGHNGGVCRRRRTGVGRTAVVETTVPAGQPVLAVPPEQQQQQHFVVFLVKNTCSLASPPNFLSPLYYYHRLTLKNFSLLRFHRVRLSLFLTSFNDTYSPRIIFQFFLFIRLLFLTTANQLYIPYHTSIYLLNLKSKLTFT